MRYYKNHSEKWWKGVGSFGTVASGVNGLIPIIGIVSVVLSWYALESDFTARLVLTVLSGVMSLICLICAVIFFIRKRRALYME